ncbi:MAG: hypothetical protein N2167_06260 [Flavobacteriales bacterium]|nr:hypothetical protein [Flavobacteriales bacterium]
MQLFQNRLVRVGIVVLIGIISLIRGLILTSLEHRNANGYDEQMWTSSSIASYQMYFKGHIRPTKELDNWWPTYAWIHGIDIFTGEKWSQFNPDTIKFPYDFITIKNISEVVKYDTLKFPRKEFQWYDRAMWTFGWKAPNVGKYIMGWFINTFASNKPDPNGYFVFAHPVNHGNVKAKLPQEYKEDEYAPSSLYSSSPFSFAPSEYIHLARIPNAIFTAFIVVLVFLTAWLYLNFWTGLIAACWLLLNQIFFDVNSAVGLDSFSTFLTTLGVVFIIATINAVRKNKPWWLVILISLANAVVIGLAIGSKLNAGVLVFISIACFVLMGLLLIWQALNKKQIVKMKSQTVDSGKSSKIFVKQLPQLIVSGIITGLISISLFIQLNPQYQGASIKKIKATRESIDDYFTKRANILTQNEKRDNPKEYNNWAKLKRDRSMKLNLMLERIAYVKDIKKNYYGTFGYILKVPFNFLDGLLALVGIIVLGRFAWKKWKQEKIFHASAMLLLAFLIIFWGNTDFLWIDWARYFTPIFPLYSILIAVGLLHIISLAKNKLAKK